MDTQRAASRRKVLALTGGGLRGVIAAACLERIEALGRGRYGPGFRLADAYDLVAGTSTGAVMATAIALGFDAARMVAFYRDDAPKVFRRKRFALPGVTEFFCSDALRGHYAEATRGRTLRRADLHTELLVMTKNLSEGAPACLTSLPLTGAGTCLGAQVSSAPVCLADLLRASTAAPGLFRPICLPIGAGGAQAVCVDGGVSPFNDPSLIAWTLVASGRFGLDWGSVGVDLHCLGAGSGLVRQPPSRLLKRPAAMLALQALKGMIVDGERQVSAAMEALADGIGPQRLRYRMQDLPLGMEAMEGLGLSLSRQQLGWMRDIADPRGTPLLYEAAAIWAEREITEPPALAHELTSPADRRVRLAA